MVTLSITRSEVVEFWVAGLPKPQGSKRAFVNPKTKRAVLTESAGAPLKDWRHDVKAFAIDAMVGKQMVVQPRGVHLSVEFVMPRPTSLPRNKPTPLAVKRPDLDKLVRAICDSLTGVVYADDSQAISHDVWKRIAEIGEQPGANIAVTALEIS